MSEFGKGFTYCLGMYLAHAESPMDDSIWFYASTDHLQELVVPENTPIEFQHKVETFKENAFMYRLDKQAGNGARLRSIQTAKDLLLEYDELCGIPCEKGDWE